MLSAQNIFIGDSNDKYRDQIIDCDEGSDCKVTCIQTNSCRNAQVLCPTDSNACTVICDAASTNWDWNVCEDLDIVWISGNSNSLTCDSKCSNVPYPPPINANTAMTINCNSQYECYGTIITCPTNAQCDIICSGRESCRDAQIICPLRATCDISCTGSDACEDATVIWSTIGGLGSLACPSGGNQCNQISTPPEQTDTIFQCNIKM